MRHRLTALLPDTLIVIGATAAAIGISLVYFPAGLIAFGVFAAAIGVMAQVGQR